MAISNPPYHTSLLTAVDSRHHIHLIVGANPLAAARVSASLAAGAIPILVAPTPTELHYGLQKHIDAGALRHLPRAFEDADLFSLGRPEVEGVVDAVFVTSARDPLARHISDLCRRKRIPVNVVDAPALCSFTLLSVHVDGPLQVGITTNGSGCKLASRIRREIAAVLPSGLGDACARLGGLRRRIQEEDRKRTGGKGVAESAQSSVLTEAPVPEAQEHSDLVQADEGTDDSVDQTAAFNKLVTDADLDAVKTRRTRWLAQVCEYWPLKRLAAVSDSDISHILTSYHSHDADVNATPLETAGPGLEWAPVPGGRVILAGSGPGHPDLLTRATYRAIQSADLILADKLVPAGVLDLIPRRTPVVIARKFPGNADQAQDEMLEQGLAAVRQGQTVLRLKQGDPFVYGRGGEEVAFFRAHGLHERDGRVVVLPGITSALSAPLFAGIPVTQRDVADQILVCTGTGKKGKPPAPPGFRPARTVVFLMALHRIVGLVTELTAHLPVEAEGQTTPTAEKKSMTIPTEPQPSVAGLSSDAQRQLWPLDTPCAVIERASCPDQRVIRTTLRYVVEAIAEEGSRPPGLLVVGKACEVLHTPEEGRSWVVEDGFRGLDLGSIASDGTAALA